MIPHYKLRLTIDSLDTLPINLSISLCFPEDEEQLAEVLSMLTTAIQWLTQERDNQKKFFDYRKEQKK